MCGIAAVVGIAKPENFQTGLAADLRHRGPDGTGSFVHSHILMVHTRLAIIDTSTAGNQPLYNEDRSLVLVCNGEIYNFQELRHMLEMRGHQFSSHSDSAMSQPPCSICCEACLPLCFMISS
jgi:asparagine synthase (glutamine-hydrolysing)